MTHLLNTDDYTPEQLLQIGMDFGLLRNSQTYNLVNQMRDAYHFVVNNVSNTQRTDEMAAYLFYISNEAEPHLRYYNRKLVVATINDDEGEPHSNDALVDILYLDDNENWICDTVPFGDLTNYEEEPVIEPNNKRRRSN
jgi:hypothetical protein